MWYSSARLVTSNRPLKLTVVLRACSLAASRYPAFEARERVVYSGFGWIITMENDKVKPAKNTICLWYDGDAEDAARFYAKTFPDSSVGAVHRAPGDFPSGKKGTY